MAALFGARVRRLRLAAGLTQTELGDKVHVVGTRITQIERASGAKPTLELARALDAVLGADDLLVELWPYVCTGRRFRTGRGGSWSTRSGRW
ncbi:MULTISPECIES: helix-turn-helix transcriptional regulator [unclassified Streptomyces]|uniref:helix-turn-helix transcriptional regulator n=1 Tax=unclassified Streptomyces TaxID=2593676 RepID=UPI00247529D4|nr:MULTISPECIES: helix-turn-helix transcriptional regulator [unclassified Streptomyces]